MSDARRKNPKQNPERPSGVERLRRNGIEPGNRGNSGGKKGRSGRKPSEWTAFCRLAIHDKAVQDQILERLKSVDTRDFSTLLKIVSAYGAGEPPKKVRLTGLLAVASKIQGKSPDELRALAADANALLALFEEEEATEEEE